MEIVVQHGVQKPNKTNINIIICSSQPNLNTNRKGLIACYYETLLSTPKQYLLPHERIGVGVLAAGGGANAETPSTGRR